MDFIYETVATSQGKLLYPRMNVTLVSMGKLSYNGFHYRETMDEGWKLSNIISAQLIINPKERSV